LTVGRALGAPLKADSAVWVYSGLRVFFVGSKVDQIELSGRRYQTARGLRVGDSVERATALYGASCVGGYFLYCRTDGISPDLAATVALSRRRFAEVLALTPRAAMRDSLFAAVASLQWR